MKIVYSEEKTESKIVEDKYDNKRKRGETFIGYIKQFCEFTSIQGPGYIVKNIPLLER